MTGKEERKKLVKETRKKLKNNPKEFFKEIILTLYNYWTKRPFHAFFTFFIWVAIMYLGFGVIQTINNDMIYCDCTIDAYDGKLMLVHNEFVQYYNTELTKLANQYSAEEQIEDIVMNSMLNNGFLNENDTQVKEYISKEEQEEKLLEFNQIYSMHCDYNLDMWMNETIRDTLNSMKIGFTKIMLKRS